MQTILQILADTLLIFLLLGSAFAAAFGLGLVFRAEWCLAFNTAMSRWVSTRRMIRTLERTRDTQRPLYRHHRVIGLAVALGAFYALLVLAGLHDLRPLAQAIGKAGRARVWEVYLDAGRWFLIVGNAFALGVGIALVVRPSLLKGLEAWANRHYSLRPFGKFMETMIYSPDALVAAYPRACGIVIAVAGAWVFANLLALAAARI
jgi:hypothetical protein